MIFSLSFMRTILFKLQIENVNKSSDYFVLSFLCCCRSRSGVSPYVRVHQGEAPGGSAVGEPRPEASLRRPHRPAESGPPRAACTTGLPTPSWLGGRGNGIGARRCDSPSSSPGREGSLSILCGGDSH